MVHVDHGIGRFEGLKTIEVQGAPHDCLLLIYAGNDRLFLPVENIELLTRYGAEDNGTQLDRLGGGAWQAKKARLKERIREIAEDLIKTAAARELKAGDILAPPDGAFDEFCARFPYEETEDQLTAIEAVLERSAEGPSHGPADLRRRGLRQNRGGAPHRLHRRHEWQAGGRRGADNPSGAPALRHLHRALQGPAAAPWPKPHGSWAARKSMR